ncbi:hypothetical protein D3C86_1664530 [compost metagenome]
MRNGIFHAKECSPQINVERTIPILRLHIFDWRQNPVDASISKNKVNLSPGFCRLLKRLFNPLGIGDVDVDRDRLTAALFNLLLRLFQPLVFQIHEAYFHALLREHNGGSTSNTGSCSGNDSYLVF